MPISQSFLNTQITNTESLITAWTAALQAFADNGAIQTYKLDTGQTVQTVTRADLDMIQRTLDSLYNTLSTLCARRDGAGSIVVPAW